MTPDHFSVLLAALREAPAVLSLYERGLAQLRTALVDAGFEMGAASPLRERRPGARPDMQFWSRFEVLDGSSDAPFRVHAFLGMAPAAADAGWGLQHKWVASLDLPDAHRNPGDLVLATHEAWPVLPGPALWDAFEGPVEALDYFLAELARPKAQPNPADAAAFVATLAAKLAP